MFDKEYSFKGSHAQKVIELTAKFNDKTAIFKTNIEVFIIGAVIGFLYQKKSISDNNKDKDGKVPTTKIFLEAFNSHKTDLEFAYRLIILSDKNYEPTFENRVNKAFKSFYEDGNEDDFNLFEQYVLGGIDILYEKLIPEEKTSEEFVLSLYSFIDELHTRYDENDDSDLAEKLMQIAQS